MVLTDHKLMQDALGLTSNPAKLQEIPLSLTIVYMKRIHKPAEDTILRLNYGPINDDRDNWMTFIL